MPVATGYDNIALNHQLLLDLPFNEATGTLVHDRAKPHHELTLHGTPVWTALANGLMVLDFDRSNPDWLDCPAANTADLDFTTENFSMATWTYFHTVANNMMLIDRGLFVTDGYYWYTVAFGGPTPYFVTAQAGSNQVTIGVDAQIVATTWQLLGITRNGASVRIYLNGTDTTYTAGTHIDPLTANRDLRVGVNQAGLTAFDGLMYRPRIWGRQLSADEMMILFQLERGLFGV